jgi:glutathione synthase/RimK-type ligase-like ATP-grasp enzyme
MTVQIVVVESASDWQSVFPEATVVLLDDYIAEDEYFRLKNAQVINLCRNYRYLSVGYYCSLLAEARGHRVIPAVRTILDLSSKAFYGLVAGNLDSAVEKGFRRSGGEDEHGRFEMDVFFGRCRHPALNDLSRNIFEAFPCPMLRVRFERGERWRIASIKPLAVHRLGATGHGDFGAGMEGYLRKPWRKRRSPQFARYDLAILHDPDDPMPPSNARALGKFVKAGKTLGMEVELITRRDFGRLSEYDALFIRDTTRIAHYTYRFSKRAESEGLVVIDDPTSILRCTNKVYLAELLRARGIPTPRTLVVGKQDLDAAEQALSYPMVLKMPEGSFSRGVFKVDNGKHLRQVAATLFRESELILAQAYTYTEFDWRIGIIDRRPIYACQYFMSKRHWQIIKHDESGAYDEGVVKTWPVETVPADVVETALKAANLIGDGLYGVDLKQGREGIYVIEINDNPSIDAGIEDMVLKDGLYATIMGEFARRIERRRAWGR